MSKLELVKETEANGFCEIRDKLELKDVFGDDYIIAELDDDAIIGKRNGKIELSVTFPGTKIVEKGTYYFSSDLKGILIVNSSGEIVSINQSGFSKAFIDEALKNKVELAVRIEERYGNRTADDKPSQEYIEAILNLEDLDFIPSTLKDDYNKPVTRIELAETFVNLIEYISGETLKRSPESSRFTDTDSKLAELAYDLGIVDVLLPTTFEPYEEITPVTLAKAIDRMLVVLNAYSYNKEKLIIENDIGTNQKIFSDIDKVSISHRKYIEKYAIDYGIIEGKNNKLYPQRALTREVFLYYISKLVF